MREGSYMASETGEKRTQPWHFDIYEEDDGGYAGVALKFIETAQSLSLIHILLLFTAAFGHFPLP